MWPELTAYDFRVEARSLEVPVYLFHGRHDQNTPAELVEQYFAILEAPHKELIWFEDSAHSPLSDEPERFKRLLREKLLAR
jgi:pimeloyl-ACP methyl ester carboxylesterase